jgi:hypothetical protein
MATDPTRPDDLARSDAPPDADPDPTAGRVAVLGGMMLLALLAAPLLRGDFYLYDDLLTFHLPLRVFYARCLAAGDDPRWFPGYFRGFDLHGEGQAGLLHPAHVALYGLLPVPAALPLEFLLNYALLFAGTVAFLRRWTGLAGAAVGAIAATFFGYAILHFMHINSVAILAHLPWALWLVDRMLRGPGNGRRLAVEGAALALVIASALLLGHPQTVWYVGLVGVAHAAAVAVGERRGRRLLLVSAFAMLGVLLGAVQLVPMWDATARSLRATLPESGVLLGSLHPLNLVQLVAPYGLMERHVPTRGGAGLERFIHRHELGLYPGAAVAPLVIWLALRWRSLMPPQRRLAGAGLVLAALGLLLALGDYGPFGAILTRLPLVRQFRVPARYVLLTQMGLAAAVAVAVDDLLRRGGAASPARVRGRMWLATAPLLTAAGLALLVVASRRSPATVGAAGTPARLGFNLLLATLAAAGVALASRRPRLGLAGLLLLTLADAAAYGLYFHVWDTVVPLRPALAPAADVPPVPPGARLHVPPPDPIAAPDRPAPGRLALAGYRLTGGYVALEPARRLRLDGPSDAPIRLAGAAWAWDDAARAWRAVPGFAPRVRAVARTVAGERPPRVPDGFDPGTAAIVDRPVTLDPGEPGRAALDEDRPGRVRAVVEAPGRRLLVLNEAYHPGWSAALDGVAVPVERADYDAMGVVVPAGRHEVLFRFRPPAFRLGAIVSGVGLVALLALGLAVRRRGAW